MQDFDEKIATELCEIMGRHKSDKGHKYITHSKHNYTTYYFSVFNKIRQDELKIFELGLGTDNITIPSNMGANGRPGASLYGWAEFFPNSKIFGADIDKEILFNTDRIKTFYCDQTNAETIKDMWSLSDLNGKFDIILEDGLHTFDANVCFFENSIDKLSENGYFIIEDVKNSEMHLFEDKIKEWRRMFDYLNFDILKIPSLTNIKDNNLIVVTFM